MTPLTWVAARPDGRELGIGLESGAFLFYDLIEKRVVRRLEGNDFVVRARWTPDGGRLLVASMGGLVRVCTGDGTPVGEIRTGHPKLRDLAIDPRGGAWATCGSDAALRVWDPSTLQLRLELVDGKLSCNGVGFVKGHLVAGYEDGYSVAWTDDGKEKAGSVVVTAPPVYSLAAGPAGDRVVYGGGKGGMFEMKMAGPWKDWNAGTHWKGTPPKPIAVNALEFAPDGRFLAAFSDDTASLFRSTGDRFGTSLGTPFYHRSPKPAWTPDFIVSGACFVPGGDFVATSHFDGTLRLWRGTRLEETLPLGGA